MHPNYVHILGGGALYSFYPMLTDISKDDHDNSKDPLRLRLKGNRNTHALHLRRLTTIYLCITPF